MTTAQKGRVLGWARYTGRQGTMSRNDVRALGGGIGNVVFSRGNWIAIADEKAAQVYRHLAATQNWVPDRRDRTIPDPPETLCPPEWEWVPNDGKQPSGMPVNIVAVSPDFVPKQVRETGFFSRAGKIGADKGAPAGTYGSQSFEVVV